MSTESFDNNIIVYQKTAKSFDSILKSKRKTIISKSPIAQDANIKAIKNLLKSKSK